MTANYDEIRRINIEDYGKRLDQWARRFLDNLYSDETHFIYELLQNAEDAEATKVRFHLHDDYLTFEHNGRAFSERDVRAICGLADTDKDEDLTQIGRFGLGFKSVNAFTRTPEIHSESEHFVIKKYVQPHAIAEQHSELGTLFRFPFNHGDKTKESSHDEIARRLKDLGIRTLLFLQNLESVEYCIDGESSGLYCRKTVEEYPGDFAREVGIVGRVDEDYEAKENWLVFKRDISALVPQNVANLSVEIAFLLSGAPSDQRPEFQRITDSSLVVYFPTEKETRLGFLIQGPYGTTPARDNIPLHKDFNQTLVSETGALLVDALCWLRDQDWLTVALLETMPLAYKERERYWDRYYSSYRDYDRTERFYDSTFLEPVFEAFTQAVLTEALIPSSGGNYVSAQDAKIPGSVALRDLLDSSTSCEGLGFDGDSRWISEDITERRTPNLWRFLLTILEVDQIDDEKFARRINNGFLTKQTDDWMRKFYEYLPSGHTIQTILRDKSIIRLRDGSHVTPFDDFGALQAYLPTAHESRFPTVKPDVCSSSKARRSLENLGLMEPDIVDEVLTEILPKYYGDPEIHDDELHHDLKVIKQAMNVDSTQRRRRLEDVLKDSAFLRATNTAGASGFCKPGDLYFRSPELAMYFEENSSAWFLSPEYEQYTDVLLGLGVSEGIRISRRNPNRHGHVTLENWHGWHVRGLRGFDPRWSVDGLEFALNDPSVRRSEFIWNRILIPHNHLITGEIESCTRQTFVGSTTETAVSNIGKLVREKAWLPNVFGGFVPPSELSLDDLPEDFHRDTELANELGMRTSFGEVIKDLLNNDDIPESDIDLFEMLKDSTVEEREHMRNELRERRRRNTEGRGDRYVTESDETISRSHSAESADQESDNRLEETPTEHSQTSGLYSNLNRPGETQLSDDFTPPRPLPDPEFRSRRIQQELEDAIENEPDRSERIRQVSRTEWECTDPATREFLYQQYHGKCQICGDTFPKRDGKPYFEAVYLESRTQASWLDRPGNSLCLCANHAAQFIQSARKFNPDFREQVMSYQNGEQHDVALTLVGKQKTIFFTQKHIIDLKEILKEILESEASDLL